MAKRIQEIKAEFDLASPEKKKNLCRIYAADERSGVQALIRRVEREAEKLLKEYARIERMLEY